MELTAPTVERLKLAATAANRTASLDRAKRTFKAVALSGRPIPRIDTLTGREFMLRFDPAGADFSRITAGTCPLLNSHRDGSLEDRIGFVKGAEWRNGALLVECQLGTGEAAERLLADLEAGIPAGVSLGVLLKKWEDARDKDGRLLERTVTAWEIFEVSIVPVPADGAAVTLSLEDESMQEQNSTNLFDAPAAERERAVELNKIGKALGLGETFTSRHVETGTSVEAFRKLALEELVRRYEAAPTRSQVAVVRDETEVRREAATLGLMHRLRGGEPAEIARPYLHLRLPDVARETLRWRGERLIGMSDARVVTLAMTRSDFPHILADVANKSLLDAYQAAPAALKTLCRIVSARDFKTKRTLRIGEGTGLVEKHEAGEYQYGSVAEQTSSYSVKTYGRIFSFSREAIVNDDLGAIDAWTRAAGRLAVAFEAQLLADLLTANGGTGPILADGLPLFHASRGNVATGSGSALSLTALSAARLAMRRQKALDGEVVIDAEPKFLVVPASLQTAAEQLVTQITAADPEKVNPFSGKLTPIVEPRLDDSSSSAWYASADPARVPTFEFAYLEGSEGPTTEQEWDFDRDVWKYKVRLDVGAGVVDWRGIYRAAGA